MDDLGQKINNLLNSPDGMAKIQSALAALGSGGLPGMDGTAEPSGTDSPAAPVPPPPVAAPSPAVQESPASPLPDLSSLMKLAPMLTGLNQEDENTVLLKALRPYLHGDREKRLDDAIKIMQLMKFLPLLQDKGIL